MARLYFLFLTRRHLKPHALQANHIEELPLDSSASLAVVDAQCGQAFAWGGLAVGAARRRAFWRRAVSSKAFFRPMWMDSSIHRTPPGLLYRTAHNGDAWRSHYARCLSGSSTAVLLAAALYQQQCIIGAPRFREREREARKLLAITPVARDEARDVRSAEDSASRETALGRHRRFTLRCCVASCGRTFGFSSTWPTSAIELLRCPYCLSTLVAIEPPLNSPE